jgi:hypothetical protein
MSKLSTTFFKGKSNLLHMNWGWALASLTLSTCLQFRSNSRLCIYLLAFRKFSLRHYLTSFPWTCHQSGYHLSTSTQGDQVELQAVVDVYVVWAYLIYGLVCKSDCMSASVCLELRAPSAESLVNLVAASKCIARPNHETPCHIRPCSRSQLKTTRSLTSCGG